MNYIVIEGKKYQVTAPPEPSSHAGYQQMQPAKVVVAETPKFKEAR
jgi:hypothetical protein